MSKIIQINSTEAIADASHAPDSEEEELTEDELAESFNSIIRESVALGCDPGSDGSDCFELELEVLADDDVRLTRFDTLPEMDLILANECIL